jgi:hypothetical protein
MSTIGRALDRDIFRLALPALGTLAADPLVSLIDTAFVGQLGSTALGGLGVATAVFSIAFFMFNFLAYGTTPLVAGAVARGDTAEAEGQGDHAREREERAVAHRPECRSNVHPETGHADLPFEWLRRRVEVMSITTDHLQPAERARAVPGRWSNIYDQGRALCSLA